MVSLQNEQKYTPAMSQQTAPFFSVIIPTYNRAYCIGRAIESVLVQTEPHWELIVVDDGSTDNTAEIVREYIHREQRIKLVVQSNHGTGAARQTGIRLAQGDFVTFLDSDDEYEPEHLAVRRRSIQAHPEVDLFFGGVHVIGSPLVPDRHNPAVLVPIEQCAVGGTFVIRRSVAAALGFSPLRYADDADFFERAIDAGIVTLRITEPTYRYNRLSPDSLCNQRLLHLTSDSHQSINTYG
jgi:glycosyltransferase involved in cell wall biosynthesis